MKVRHNSTQLAMFSPGIVIVDKIKAANTINEKVTGYFNGDPVIIPATDDVPPEMPRILLSTKEKNSLLNIAGNRVDYVFKYKKEEKEYPFPVPGFYQRFLAISEFFFEDIHAPITRLAMVTNWILECEGEAAAETILSRYIKQGTPIKKPFELELHFLTKGSIADLDVNKWVRIKSVHKKSGSPNQTAIILETDINTVAEKTYNFNKDSVRKFLDQCSSIVNTTLEENVLIIEGGK